MKKRGIFITFEGGEGSGKSTQAKILYDYLIQRQISTILTREPGGTDQSEEIRNILLSGNKNKWDGVSEALLHYASRREHLKKKIIPALEKGIWVVCDRYCLSTEAYQGAGYGVSINFIKYLEKKVCEDLNPDLTFILDLKEKESLKRLERRNENNRYEDLDISFHKKVRKYFKSAKKTKKNNFIIINADNTIDDISKKIISYLQQKFF